MAVYQISVPISPTSDNSQPLPDEAVSRFCEAFRIELRRALPYVGVSVARGDGPPEILADSDEDVQWAWRCINATYERVMRRRGWEQPEPSPRTAAIFAFDAVPDGRGGYDLRTVRYGRTS
jgi:hypothetical protein